MIKSKKFIIAALVFPIASLLALAISKATVRVAGTEIILDITGYDPRDLLAGHYLIYNIDYGVSGLCQREEQNGTQFICLDTRITSRRPPSDCRAFIKGICQGSRFVAGIERYYIPQEYALALERLVIDKKGSVVLSVMPNGTSQVKELRIEGQVWHEYLRTATSQQKDQ